MSLHEGVTCDFCMKENFPGKRFKCLICYDFDLCETCVLSLQSSGKHIADHAMQCILTCKDCENFLSGDDEHTSITSYTCPYCGKSGLSKATLLSHCNEDHFADRTEVICPVCATSSRAEPNYSSVDLIQHLNTDHRTPTSEFGGQNGSQSSRIMRRLMRRMPSHRGIYRHLPAFAAGSNGGRDMYSDMTEAIESIRRQSRSRGRGHRRINIPDQSTSESRPADIPASLPARFNKRGSYFPKKTMASVVAGGNGNKKENVSDHPLIDKLIAENKQEEKKFSGDESAYAFRAIMLSMSSEIDDKVSFDERVAILEQECNKIEIDEERRMKRDGEGICHH